MPRLIPLLLSVLALAGCDRLPSLPGSGLFARDLPATPLAYRAELVEPDGSDRFRVAVTDGGAPLAATRESVRFAATRYCLRHAGSSHIDWAAAAGDPSAWRGMRDAAGRTVYSGRCTGR